MMLVHSRIVSLLLSPLVVVILLCGVQALSSPSPSFILQQLPDDTSQNHLISSTPGILNDKTIYTPPIFNETHSGHVVHKKHNKSKKLRWGRFIIPDSVSSTSEPLSDPTQHNDNIIDPKQPDEFVDKPIFNITSNLDEKPSQPRQISKVDKTTESINEPAEATSPGLPKYLQKHLDAYINHQFEQHRSKNKKSSQTSFSLQSDSNDNSHGNGDNDDEIVEEEEEETTTSIPLPDAVELSNLLTPLYYQQKQQQQMKQLNATFSIQQTLLDPPRFRPASAVLPTSQIPNYIGKVLRREGNFDTTNYIEANVPYVSYIYWQNRDFTPRQPPTVASQAPFVTVQWYYPNTESSTGYYGRKFVDIPCRTTTTATTVFSSNYDDGCTTWTPAKSTPSALQSCIWDTAKQMYRLEIILRQSTSQLAEGNVERYGFQILYNVPTTDPVIQGRESIWVRPTVADMTISQEKQVSLSSIYKFKMVPNTRYTDGSTTTVNLDVLNLASPIRTPLGSTITFSMLFFDAYVNPILPIRLPGSLNDYWPQRNLLSIATLNGTPYGQLYGTIPPTNGIFPSHPIVWAHAPLAKVCAVSNWQFVIKPYVADTNIQVLGQWTNQGERAQVYNTISFAINTYTNLPAVWITTPRITPTERWTQAIVGGLPTNIKQTQFVINFQQLDKFGNPITYTSLTSPPRTVFTLLSSDEKISHPTCPQYPTCSNSGCCQGSSCTITFVLNSLSDSVVSCYYGINHPLRLFPGEFYGQEMDVLSPTPDVSQHSMITTRLSVDIQPTLPTTLKWQCRLEGEPRWFNDCTVASFFANYCSSLSSQCLLYVTQKRCVDPQDNDKVYPNEICNHLTSQINIARINITNVPTCINNDQRTNLYCPTDPLIITDHTPVPHLVELKTGLTVDTQNLPYLPVVRFHQLTFTLFNQGYQRIITNPGTTAVRIYIHKAQPGHTCRENLPNPLQQPHTCFVVGVASWVTSSNTLLIKDFDPGDRPGGIFKISCYINGQPCILHNTMLYGVMGPASPTATPVLPVPTPLNVALARTDWDEAYRLFAMKHNVPLILDVPAYVNERVVQRTIPRQLFFTAGQWYNSYIPVFDNLGNEISKPLTNPMQLMVMVRYRDSTSIEGEAVICSNVNITNPLVEDPMGNYDINGNYIPSYLHIPTLHQLTPHAMRFWGDGTKCYWDEKAKRYRLHWFTTHATPVRSRYNSNGDLTTFANYTELRVIYLDPQHELSSGDYLISSTASTLAIAPVDQLDLNQSTFAMWYTDPTSGSKQLFNGNEILPPQTVYSWEARLVDILGNKIYPILTNGESSPDVWLNPIFDYNTTLYTNVGFYPKDMRVVWLNDDADDGTVYYSASFGNLGALEYNVTINNIATTITNDDQLPPPLAQYTIRTSPSIPYALGPLEIITNVTSVRSIDPITDQLHIAYSYIDIGIFQLYDEFGNPSPIPDANQEIIDDDDDDDDGDGDGDAGTNTDGDVILPRVYSEYDIIANDVTLWTQDSPIELAAEQTRHCPTLACLNTTTYEPISSDKTCCNSQTGQCLFYWAYEPLPEDSLYNEIQCIYRFGGGDAQDSTLKYTYAGFANVKRNVPYNYTLTKSKHLPSIYQTKCIIAEDTDKRASSLSSSSGGTGGNGQGDQGLEYDGTDLYLDSLRPNINIEDAQRLLISHRVVNCNYDAIFNAFCTSTPGFIVNHDIEDKDQEEQKPLSLSTTSTTFKTTNTNTTTETTQCPIYISKKVCYDATYNHIVDPKLCSSGYADWKHNNDQTLNQFHGGDQFIFDIAFCTADEVAKPYDYDLDDINDNGTYDDGNQPDIMSLLASSTSNNGDVSGSNNNLNPQIAMKVIMKHITTSKQTNQSSHLLKGLHSSSSLHKQQQQQQQQQQHIQQEQHIQQVPKTIKNRLDLWCSYDYTRNIEDESFIEVIGDDSTATTSFLSLSIILVNIIFIFVVIM